MLAVGLGLEALIFGVATAWLLALAPTAVVTMLKGRWSLFFTGWLTLGLTWIIAAVSLAPPDSWWARRLYDEERLARAADPIRHPRSRPTTALALGSTLVAIVVLGLAASRPSPVLGVNGEVLGHSVGHSNSAWPCLPAGERAWTCKRYDDQSSSTIDYRVKVSRSGCWTAIRTGPDDEESDRRVNGCVTIVDHILG